jgi:hypothetical protein
LNIKGIQSTEDRTKWHKEKPRDFYSIKNTTKLDKEKNQCIREETGIQNMVKEIKQYQKKWLQHVQRMDKNRIPRQALKYRSEGRRNVGRPKKRWRDQLHFED